MSRAGSGRQRFAAVSRAATIEFGGTRALGHQAKLSSVDAVRSVRVALDRFGEQVAVALTDLDIEARRACDYIQADRKAYWKSEVDRGWDRLAQAKAQLEQRQTLGKVAGHEPSCIEEKRAVQAAKHRLETAMEKVGRVRHWSQMVSRAAGEYQGAIGQLTRWIEAELPVAIALLRRIEATLDRYLAVDAPVPDEVLAELTSQAAGSAGRTGAAPSGSPPVEAPSVAPAAESPNSVTAGQRDPRADDGESDGGGAPSESPGVREE